MKETHKLESCITEETLIEQGFHKRGNDYFKRVHHYEIRYVHFIDRYYIYDRTIIHRDEDKPKRA